MASAWIEQRSSETSTRYRVRFRVGGADTRPLYAGMFGTKREAELRRAWVLGELAAMRVPNLKLEQPS